MLANQVVAEDSVSVIIASLFLMCNCRDYSFRCLEGTCKEAFPHITQQVFLKLLALYLFL